jgi:hypothetical protein
MQNFEVRSDKFILVGICTNEIMHRYGSLNNIIINLFLPNLTIYKIMQHMFSECGLSHYILLYHTISCHFGFTVTEERNLCQGNIILKEEHNPKLLNANHLCAR